MNILLTVAPANLSAVLKFVCLSGRLQSMRFLVEFLIYILYTLT